MQRNVQFCYGNLHKCFRYNTDHYNCVYNVGTSLFFLRKVQPYDAAMSSEAGLMSMGHQSAKFDLCQEDESPVRTRARGPTQKSVQFIYPTSAMFSCCHIIQGWIQEGGILGVHDLLILGNVQTS